MRNRPAKSVSSAFAGVAASSNRVAVLAPDLKAGVIYYGLQVPADQVATIRAPLLLHYAGLDQRVNAGIPAYEAALKGQRQALYTLHLPNVNHAFNQRHQQPL